jgi:ribulose-5-phosphate 4-epimerase/fuculose-1-phosphate aldolase
MQDQVNKYLKKLLDHGLIATPADAQLYGLDDEIYTNNERIPDKVSALFDDLSINSLLIARPDPLRWAIISELALANPGLISPKDTESLTFIHDIPVVESFDPDLVACALNLRKGCIVKDSGIITTGTVSLEQAFIVMSSICFACFVKFFTDILCGLRSLGGIAPPSARQIDDCLGFLLQLNPPAFLGPLSGETPVDEAGIIKAMDDAGKATVAAGLVDSFFGNISFRKNSLIYISQTGSSLDELSGRIDCVPLDGSSTCELTSSSELWAHVKIYETTGDTVILHGHPRFSVIMSMAGGPLQFGHTRSIVDVPVVAGEVGAGNRGLIHTLPQAMQAGHAAIVHGHGVFTSSATSLREAFDRLSSIERMCFEKYKEALTKKA